MSSQDERGREEGEMSVVRCVILFVGVVFVEG